MQWIPLQWIKMVSTSDCHLSANYVLPSTSRASSTPASNILFSLPFPSSFKFLSIFPTFSHMDRPPLFSKAWHLLQCAQHLPTWPPCPSILVSDLIRASSPSWHSQSASFAHTPHPTQPTLHTASPHCLLTMLRIHMTEAQQSYRINFTFTVDKGISSLIFWIVCGTTKPIYSPAAEGLPTNISSPHPIIKFEQQDKIVKHNMIMLFLKPIKDCLLPKWSNAHRCKYLFISILKRISCEP